jgi:hypothetical protein
MFPRSQKNKKFCAPYWRKYKGAQAISQIVQAIFNHSGMRTAAL